MERRLPPRAALDADRRGQGYYADFAEAGLAGLAKVLTGAYFHDGMWSSFRRRHHGRPVDTASLPGWKFLGYLQDHDQIGNRAVGDRISATLSPGCSPWAPPSC